MKSNVKMRKMIIAMLMMLVLLCTTTVHAANDSYKTTLKADHTQAKGEDTVIITIGLKDIAIESGDQGIGAYTANIKFDSSVFEYVSTSGTVGWVAPLYQDGLITGNTQNAEVVKTTQDIATITLKVKKDAKLGETTIELTNFSGSNGLNDIDTANTSTKITIVASNSGNGDSNGGNNGGNSGNNGNNGGNSGTTNNGSNTNNGNPTTGNNSSNNNNANTNIPSTSTDTSIKQGTLPQTGTTDVIVFTVIGTAGILAITFFIRMAVLNRKMK